MNLSHPLTVADRIMLTLEGLHAAVAARVRLSVLAGRGTEVLAVWLIRLICHRVRRIEGRIVRMLARFQAGKLLVRPQGTRAGGGTRAPVARRRLSAEEKLPRRLAWLLPLVPCEAANFAAQLRLTLAEPEMVALLAAAPQARRLLAPLCRMLGIEAAALAPKSEADVGSQEIARVTRDTPPHARASWPAPLAPAVAARPERRATAPPDG